MNSASVTLGMTKNGCAVEPCHVSQARREQNAIAALRFGSRERIVHLDGHGSLRLLGGGNAVRSGAEL